MSNQPQEKPSELLIDLFSLDFTHLSHSRREYIGFGWYFLSTEPQVGKINSGEQMAPPILVALSKD